VDAQAIPVPFVSPDLDPYLSNWPPRENDYPNHISGSFAVTCSLMQIAREVASAVYVRPRSVSGFDLLTANYSSDFSRVKDQDANEFRIAQME
jgi:hypothetical protein